MVVLAISSRYSEQGRRFIRDSGLLSAGAAGMLDSHVPRDQKHEQFQEDSRLLLHHFVDRLAAAATEGKMHLADGVGVESVTRALGIPAKVSLSQTTPSAVS